MIHGVHQHGILVNLLLLDLDEALADGLDVADARKMVLERGDEAERKRLRLLVGEHHRRQLESGYQAVTAVTALLRGDRNPHFFQHRDIAAQRAPVDLDATRELRAADLAVGLQQLEHREDADGGMGHTPTLPVI